MIATNNDKTIVITNELWIIYIFIYATIICTILTMMRVGSIESIASIRSRNRSSSRNRNRSCSRNSVTSLISATGSHGRGISNGSGRSNYSSNAVGWLLLCEFDSVLDGEDFIKNTLSENWIRDSYPVKCRFYDKLVVASHQMKHQVRHCRCGGLNTNNEAICPVRFRVRTCKLIYIFH